jgi:hypothetical protein
MAAATASSAAASGKGHDIISTMHSAEHDMVLILDFGSQYSHIIVRRVRGEAASRAIARVLTLSSIDSGRIALYFNQWQYC